MSHRKKCFIILLIIAALAWFLYDSPKIHAEAPAVVIIDSGLLTDSGFDFVRKHPNIHDLNGLSGIYACEVTEGTQVMVMEQVTYKEWRVRVVSGPAAGCVGIIMESELHQDN